MTTNISGCLKHIEIMKRKTSLFLFELTNGLGEMGKDDAELDCQKGFSNQVQSGKR